MSASFYSTALSNYRQNIPALSVCCRSRLLSEIADKTGNHFFDRGGLEQGVNRERQSGLPGFIRQRIAVNI